MRVAVKPTSTISIDQETIDMRKLKNAHLPSITRRDPTICARFVPVAEAMAALAVADGLLLYWGYERWCGVGGLGK
jgi:chorismate synthase